MPPSFAPNQTALPQGRPANGQASIPPVLANQGSVIRSLKTNPNLSLNQLDVIRVQLQGRLLDTQQRIDGILRLPPPPPEVKMFNT